MTDDASCIVDPVPSNQVFHAIVGDVTATATGSVCLLIENSTGERHRILLTNVFLVAGLPQDAVSLDKLDFDFRWQNTSQVLYKCDKDGNTTTFI